MPTKPKAPPKKLATVRKRKPPLRPPASDKRRQTVRWDGPTWPTVMRWLLDLIKIVVPLVLKGKK